MMSGMERMSCFRFIREVVWRGCLVFDSYDEWYGEDVLILDSYIREVVWRGCLVLDSYDEWYGEDVLF